MTKEIQIESNIPLPRAKQTKWVRIAQKMDVGDSVLLDSNKQANCLYVALIRLGHSVRMARDNGGIRVWKQEANHDQSGAGL